MKEELSFLDKIIKNKKAAIFDPGKINKFLFVLTAALGIYYVATMNDLSVKGFRLQEIKKEAKELVDDNKNLELKLIALISFNNLNERIKSLGMTAAGKISYIESGAPVVAKK